MNTYFNVIEKFHKYQVIIYLFKDLENPKSIL